MKRFLASLLFVAGTILSASGAFYSTPTLPRINTNNVIIVTNVAYGAKADNSTDNAAAIQAAINAAALGGLTNGGAGGTVEIPAGTNAYLCGPLAMKSSINLQVDAGAILRMLPFGRYPAPPPNFIGATNLTDVEISGSGAIDGQGSAWWTYFATNSSLARPIMARIQGCSRQLVQNVTLSNSPEFHLSFSGSKGNITVQGVTIQSPPSEANPPAKNTDACDVSGTNILVQNCNISVGDDDFTCGGSTSGVLITNNIYGNGHGISIGSDTDNGGVSNITVINCTMNGPDNGIRIKSDNDRGGLVQNISYYNIGMTNVHFPIQIIGYYNQYSTPDSITAAIAASTNAAAITGFTPIYRNITFSNITATSISGFPVGIVWARTEMPATNIVFNKVSVNGDRNFCLYNVRGAQFIDCNFQVSSTYKTFVLYDAQAIITNSVPTNTQFTFDGLTTNGYGNALAFYNAQGSLVNTNALAGGSLTLAASTFTVSNNLSLPPSTSLNYTLSTNTTKLAVVGNLTLGGTNNISSGNGFTNGSYTLMTYTGALSGALPVIGSIPTNYSYTYSFDTSTLGQVNLIVTLPGPTNLVATATNLLINVKWNSVGGASAYNLKRGTSDGGSYPTMFSGLTATNFADANVTNAVKYFYIVTAFGAGGESANSMQASAIPLPSNQPTNLLMQVAGGQLQLSWPQDHLGWRLQIQTNDLSSGLSTNWVTVPNSTNIMATVIDTSPTNGSVFLRLVYP
ncbi:MAG TPA: glycosyl hydrolase family 28 protein [Verrucomicrobiae bacterium]|nr:glycosyl hydrolase family 28 protein [Verrucomicrobiae bacterium]